MGEFLTEALHAPLGTIFVLAGLAFMGIAVVGKIIGKIEPGKGGRIAAGVLGTVLLLAGIQMHVAELQTHIGPDKGRPKAPSGTETRVRQPVVPANAETGSSQAVVSVKVYSHGQIRIRGTWSCDLDIGREVASDGEDFWWEQVDSRVRHIVPKHGARFTVLGVRDLDSVSYSDLAKLNYSMANIDGSDATYNRIPQGTVIAAITNEGRYSKFRVDEYGYNLLISWVTYEKP